MTLAFVVATPALLSAGTASLGGEPELEAIPEPRLEAMEPAVREQLVAARTELERQLDDAVSAVAKSAAGNQGLAASFGGLGNRYHAYDLFVPAAACYRNAERLDPADFRWPYYLGVLLQLDGHDDDALAAFLRASQLRPNHLPILLRLAELHLGAGRDDQAAALYGQVLASNPASAAALVGLGRIASARGDRAGAVERFEEALELQPEASRLHFLIGQEYRRLGELDKAAEHLARTGSVGVGYFEPLLVEVQRLAVGAGAALGRGGDAQMLGMYDVALREYRRAVAQAPENADAHFALGSLLLAMGAVEDAGAALAEAVRLAPDQAQARFLLGHALFLQGRAADAEPELRRALELDAGLGEARSTLAALLASTGRLDQAIAAYREVLEADPSDDDARLGLGKALVMSSRVDEGLREFDSVLATARDASILAQAHYNRAVVEAGRTPRQAAVASLARALELDSRLADARKLLARLLASLGRVDDALSEYEQLLAGDPGNTAARLSAAAMLAAAGRAVEARELLEAGLDDDSEGRPVARLLARLLACAEPEGARDGAAALALAQELFDATRSLENAEALAMALAEAGRFEEAAALQQSLLEEAARRGLAAWQGPLERNLDRYRARQRCRLVPPVPTAAPND